MNKEKGKDNPMINKTMMNSYYGFGEKLMNKYMD